MMDVLFPGSVPGQLSPKYDRHLPRAPSPAQGVTPCGMTSWVTWEGITLPSSLLRAHAPDQNPLSASVFPCTKSLGRLLRIPPGSWPFLTLSLESFSTCLDPYPGCSCGARARYFPQNYGLPGSMSRSALGISN